MAITIRDIRTICARPSGFNQVIVRIDTSEPELYGLGCASFTYRWNAVKMVVEEYFKPLLVGREVSRIEDIWQMLNTNSYWRSGPIMNNAISGIDMALWDIKGKMAKMPVYELLGGKMREAVPVYRYTETPQLETLAEEVLKLKEEGCRHIRIQWHWHEDPPVQTKAPKGSLPGFYIDPLNYCRDTVKMFDYIRKTCGEEIELCHDVHERIPPTLAMKLLKDVEEFRPFFMEDPVSPDQGEWLRIIRAQTTTPIAYGELFDNPVEWETVVKDRLLDFMRAHITQIGGITPARKLMALCEQFGVRMAWHGSPDSSPLMHAANMHLDIACPNFGIQEWPELTQLDYDLYHGAPVVKGSYAYINDKPGWGIEIDEELMARYPAEDYVTHWIEMRLPDGSLQKP